MNLALKMRTFASSRRRADHATRCVVLHYCIILLLHYCIQSHEFPLLKTTNFALNMMVFVLQMSNFAFKMWNSAFIMWTFVFKMWSFVDFACEEVSAVTASTRGFLHFNWKILYWKCWENDGFVLRRWGGERESSASGDAGGHILVLKMMIIWF